MDAQILKEALREKGYDVDHFSEEAGRLIYDVMTIVENPPQLEVPKIEGRYFQ